MEMDLDKLVHSHAGLAYLSLMLLLARGVLAAKTLDWRKYKVLNIAPHILHTLLIASGLTLAWQLGYSAGTMWIWTKLFFLVLYVIFSAKAFRKSQPFSLKYFLLAVISFMLIITAATLR